MFPKYSRLKMRYNQKINLCVMDLEKILYYVTYHNNRAQKLDSRNRIRVRFYTYFAVFLPRSTFYNFFPKINSLKTHCANFFFGQVEISLGKEAFDTTCPTGKLLKKLISTPTL